MLASTFAIQQGTYDLTEAAMRLRGQRALHAGDDYRFDFVYTDLAGAAVDITGATIRFTAKYTVIDVDVSSSSVIVAKDGFVVGDPANGNFSVALSGFDIVNPQHIRGVYSVKITIGTTTETVVFGSIEFLPNIDMQMAPLGF